MITAQIRLEVPRETVVVVADSQRAVDNIVAALQEDGVYEDHALLKGRALASDLSVRFDRGAWISGPCLDADDLETGDVYAHEADDADADELDAHQADADELDAHQADADELDAHRADADELDGDRLSGH